MRIAVVHGYYSSRVPSGENIVVDLQVNAMRRAGHDVRVISRRQESVEKSFVYPVLAAAHAATNRGPRPNREIDTFDPDIVHVHNLFPNFGRTWTSKYSSRLVATVHNYRPICAAATLLREAKSCTLCPDHRSALPAMKYGCFKGRVATLPVAIGTRFNRDPLLLAAQKIVCINDEMLARYAAVGVPAEKLVIVPNFVRAAAVPGSHRGDGLGDFWLFVGRTTEEKGILPLVRRWPEGPRLKVVGSGPLDNELREAASPNVELLGQRTQDEVRALMDAARGLLFPSIWPEGLPTVYLEALAAGLPVIASSHSIVARLVSRDGTGIVGSDSVADDLAKVRASFAEISTQCRSTYDALYTESAWSDAMQSVYDEVVKSHR